MTALQSDLKIEVEIAGLQDLEAGALRDRWKARFGRTAPKLPKSLLSRLLAYKVQAEVLGDIDPKTGQFIDRLARSHPDAPPPRSIAKTSRLEPGTILVREHGGMQHRVTVIEGGFCWNGKEFPNLSTVAFAITGTKWNGPAFFGLRKANK